MVLLVFLWYHKAGFMVWLFFFWLPQLSSSILLFILFLLSQFLLHGATGITRHQVLVPVVAAAIYRVLTLVLTPEPDVLQM